MHPLCSPCRCLPPHTLCDECTLPSLQFIVPVLAVSLHCFLLSCCSSAARADTQLYSHPFCHSASSSFVILPPSSSSVALSAVLCPLPMHVTHCSFAVSLCDTQTTNTTTDVFLSLSHCSVSLSHTSISLASLVK